MEGWIEWDGMRADSIETQKRTSDKIERRGYDITTTYIAFCIPLYAVEKMRRTLEKTHPPTHSLTLNTKS